MLADDEITCRINGPLRLMGLEASNNQDMTDYTDNHHRVFRGRIVAYVQAKNESGKAEVSFTAPWLKGTKVLIDVE